MDNQPFFCIINGTLYRLPPQRDNNSSSLQQLGQECSLHWMRAHLKNAMCNESAYNERALYSNNNKTKYGSAAIPALIKTRRPGVKAICSRRDQSWLLSRRDAGTAGLDPRAEQHHREMGSRARWHRSRREPKCRFDFCHNCSRKFKDFSLLYSTLNYKLIDAIKASLKWLDTIFYIFLKLLIDSFITLFFFK
jgi:hypothetical protein